MIVWTRKKPKGYWATSEGIDLLKNIIETANENNGVLYVQAWEEVIKDAIPDLISALKKERTVLPKKIRRFYEEPDKEENKDEIHLSEIILEDDEDDV